VPPTQLCGKHPRVTSNLDYLKADWGMFKPWGPDAVNTTCTIAIMPLDLTLNNKCLGYIYINCKNYKRLNCHLTIIGTIPYIKYFKFCEAEIQNYSVKNTLCSKKGREQITLNQQKKNI